MDSISSTAMPVADSGARGAREAEPIEFSAVYQQYFGFAWASLRRLGVPVASIDDAAQDFWVTVHRRLPTLDPQSSTKAWLFGVARRVASHYRRRDFRNRRKLAALGEATSSRVDRSMHRRDVAMSLEVALGMLDEPKRTAFVLAELEGWSAPEIARAVGSKPNTIYSRIRLAKQQLREHLRDGGETQDVDDLTDETREATLAPAGAAKRCLAAIAPKLALGAPAVASTPLVASGLAQFKLALVGAGIGAAVVGGAHVVLPAPPNPAATASATADSTRESTVEPAPTASPLAARAAVLAAPAPEQPAPAPPPAVEPTATAKAEPNSAAAPGDEAADTLAAETQLLSEAQRALAAGRVGEALARVTEHAEQHPDGKLRDLRSVLEVDALCAAGRVDEAIRRAEAALARKPPKTVARKLAAACSGAG